jgi:hypothetical protein
MALTQLHPGVRAWAQRIVVSGADRGRKVARAGPVVYARVIARSIHTVRSRRSPSAAFLFISDLRHAPRWDPQTSAVAKTTPGAIGLGTRFVLTARLAGVSFDMPYEILRFEPSSSLVIAGETRWLRYRDEITFESEGEGVRITWDAHASLTSVLRLGNPVLTRLFQWIGERATSGLTSALERADID